MWDFQEVINISYRDSTSTILSSMTGLQEILIFLNIYTRGQFLRLAGPHFVCPSNRGRRNHRLAEWGGYCSGNVV